jgi:hypothetical protein
LKQIKDETFLVEWSQKAHALRIEAMGVRAAGKAACRDTLGIPL